MNTQKFYNTLKPTIEYIISDIHEDERREAIKTLNKDYTELKKEMEENEEKKKIIKNEHKNKKMKLKVKLRKLKAQGRKFNVYHIEDLRVINCHGDKCRTEIYSASHKSGGTRCTACYGSDTECSDLSDYEFSDDEQELLNMPLKCYICDKEVPKESEEKLLLHNSYNQWHKYECSSCLKLDKYEQLIKN